MDRRYFMRKEDFFVFPIVGNLTFSAVQTQVDDT